MICLVGIGGNVNKRLMLSLYEVDKEGLKYYEVRNEKGVVNLIAPIQNNEGYWVTAFGDVIRSKEIKQNSNKEGYNRVRFWVGKIQKAFQVSRLVASHFLGDVTNLTIDHRNTNRKDNFITNLAIVSLQENLKLRDERRITELQNINVKYGRNINQEAT